MLATPVNAVWINGVCWYHGNDIDLVHKPGQAFALLSMMWIVGKMLVSIVPFYLIVFGHLTR